MIENFNEYIKEFKVMLHNLFHNETNINELSLVRGLPDHVWSELFESVPLAVAIPEAYGGRGVKVQECLEILAAAAYESLPLSLTFGINLALFLEPLAKYGHPEIQTPIFKRFMEDKAMGGLMITEPDFGSDALNMRTSYIEEVDSYKLVGEKHWQGLTGMADFWIVAARKQNDDDLGRDVEFFVTDNSKEEQKIEVAHYFNNLGLYMIPYGLNTINVNIPKNQKLQQPSTGIKMMLDILHRSRMQFPGMGMGFIKRMLDEAMQHCTTRKIGGQMLSDFDSVRFQLSRIQSSYTLCSGMCAHSVKVSGIEHDLSGEGLEANSMKALVTDLMQEAAQICVQLSGSSGYKLENIAGRGIIDSRPFQIFEGSNEMLYTQIADIVSKKMKKLKTKNIFSYFQELDCVKGIISKFKDIFDFKIPEALVQRQMIVFGKSISLLICLQYVQKMVEKGYRLDLYENCVKHVEMDIKKLLSDFSEFNNAEPIMDYMTQSQWNDFI